jgi:hypothetical protein
MARGFTVSASSGCSDLECQTRRKPRAAFKRAKRAERFSVKMIKMERYSLSHVSAALSPAHKATPVYSIEVILPAGGKSL